MSQEIFADTVSAVYITGNMVRIDLMSLQPQQEIVAGKPVFATDKRIILPMEGFLQLFSLQEDIVRQLVETGLLKKREPDELDAVGPGPRRPRVMESQPLPNTERRLVRQYKNN